MICAPIGGVRIIVIVSSCAIGVLDDELVIGHRLQHVNAEWIIRVIIIITIVFVGAKLAIVRIHVIS